MASSITYRVTPKNPAAHLFEVVLTIEAPAKHQRVWLPVWIPGSYMVREFSRHFVTVTAKADGAPVSVAKVDKHTWETGVDGARRLEVTATVYYPDREPERAGVEVVKARRVRCIRTDEGIGGLRVSFGQYALKIESTTPVVCQIGRMDVRQANLAYYTVMGFPG